MNYDALAMRLTYDRHMKVVKPTPESNPQSQPLPCIRANTGGERPLTRSVLRGDLPIENCTHETARRGTGVINGWLDTKTTSLV